MTGVYVHIPFCLKKCDYCGFLSWPCTSEEEMEKYVDKLIEEMDHRLVNVVADTLFIGGGTPSLLPTKQLERILEHINFDENAEITIEGNPASFTKEKLLEFRRLGINRLSIGVQSFDDKILKALGRVHSSQDAYDAYAMAREAGFDNINLDLMCGVPSQTLEDWEGTLKEAIRLRPNHISFYTLQIEEGSPFYEKYKDGTLEVPDINREKAMYYKSLELLKGNGYVHYEISNASLPGFQCKHNMKYWNMEEYIGLGLGASSFDGKCHFENRRDLEKYPSLDVNHEAESLQDIAGECVFTALRLRTGLDLDRFRQVCSVNFWDYYKDIRDVIDKFLQDEKLILRDNHLIINEKYIEESNDIMCEFV
ncbi:MAG: radical SAM family heme chaperone HemW [Clostridia bacterium]|nr:radical SAM family heme chaperone HemW [Clostridia bacterium]